MELLPNATVQSRIESVLDELKVQWTRTDTEEPTEGPQSDPRDRKVVTYQVGDGPLEGTWCARGPDAELLLFDRMLEQLEEDWRYHLGEYSRVAAAMRKVGR